jgi:HEAT repeat protein
MGEPSRFCPACYSPNDWSDDRCLSCGTSLATDESYDDKLIWALGHPDTERAILAAEALAGRASTRAIDRLIELLDSTDPYRAAAAARALLAFASDQRAASALEFCQRHPSVLVRRAVAGRATARS